MKRSARAMAVAVAGVLALAGQTARADQEAAPADEGRKSSWWNWWNWGDGSWGLNFGGVTYGSNPDRIIGSDKLVNDVRTLSDVRAIELLGPIDIVIRQGTLEKATVHTDDNIAPMIETRVADGVLHVGVRSGASFRTRHPVGVTVDLKQLASLKIQGSGDVTCAQLQTDLLEITIRGSGDVRFDGLRASALAVLVRGSGGAHLTGTVPKQGFDIEGTGSIDAGELAGREVAVRVAGTGSADIWVSETLDVQISGTGDVSYRGNPRITKSITGVGTLSRH